MGERRVGFWTATGVGVGAIVGGGVLALAGAAYAATGPSAVLAFAFNGGIAALTALSYAEVSTKFPESGGAYIFAKKVLSIESAFMVGWVVWFASIAAAALYALGFGEFLLAGLRAGWSAAGEAPPGWLGVRAAPLVLALAAIGASWLALCWRPPGATQWVNIAKVAVFAVLILGGAWALLQRPLGDAARSLRPFFAGGAGGLFQAMGFTFIALQGFDLVAAVAGEVREPARTLPRAMLASLGAALVIYVPLLLLLAAVGGPPGWSVMDASRADPETIVARAAAYYLGPAGYWLVVAAGLLAMGSALHANLLAASRVAMAMARDRTLPRRLGRAAASGTPPWALAATAALTGLLAAATPSVAAAGAAASLIFLVTFALVHGVAVLVRRRSAASPPRSGRRRIRCPRRRAAWPAWAWPCTKG